MIVSEARNTEKTKNVQPIFELTQFIDSKRKLKENITLESKFMLE